MLSADIETLRHRAGLMVEHAMAGGVSAEVADVRSVVGGGTFPGVEIASCGIRVRPGDGGADGLSADLRGASTPLVGRVEDGSFWVDLRTVLPTEDDEVVELLSRHAR
jgi:L-seryl-tRNA(Ser) seleniumtransferase